MLALREARHDEFVQRVLKCLPDNKRDMALRITGDMMRRATIQQMLMIQELHGGPALTAERRLMNQIRHWMDNAADELATAAMGVFRVMDTGDVRAGTPYRLVLPSGDSNSATGNGWLVPTFLPVE